MIIISVIKKMITMRKNDLKVIVAYNHLAGDMKVFLFDS